jgi:trk system potassium uptake protein TrkH
MLFNSVFMLLSLVIAFYNHDTSQLPLLFSFLLTALFGLFPMVFVPKTQDLTNKESYLIVVLSWILSCFVGMLPLLLWGGEFTVAKAFFESVSGYTTTGASVLKNVEALPNGLLFWRSSMHWIGGIGIVIFVLIIIPSMGKARMSLSKLEISPLAQDNFRYRTQKTLRIIVVVYLGLTILQTIILMVCGMSLFDAVNHTFATIATGGFSTKNASIAFYNSIPIEIVIIVFMFLSGIHFGLLYTTFTLHRSNIFNSPIVRYYFVITVTGIIIVAINLKGSIYPTWGEAFRYAAFQVVSLSTTTGFANADSSVWPPLSVAIILFFTIQCACAGSTSGGMKIDRVVLFFQGLKCQILKLQHPQAVIPVRLGKQLVDEETINSVLLFIVLYILILFISTVILTTLGVDLLSSFSASAATMGNAGPGFGIVGSMANYSAIPEPGLLVLSFDMLLGRLEIFGLLMLFLLRSWR